MFFVNIKHNLITFFCTLLIVDGCNKQNSKLIIENKNIVQTSKKSDKILQKKNYSKNKVLKNKISLNDKDIVKSQKTNDVVFEFRNERLLQGRNINNDAEEKKTKLALTAVQKMFKTNLSSDRTELNFHKDYNISTLSRYITENNEAFNLRNIIVFLPLTGKYSNFGNKIRKSIDLSILKFGNSVTKIIYFDTGKKVEEELIINLFDKLKPRLIIGPFTREVLLKIKPLAKKKSLPIFTFSNDIAMLENNIWSLGFAPEEQIESVISCALVHGYKKFGIIAPENLYGKIITRKAINLISVDRKNIYRTKFLSNNQLNEKSTLYSNLKKFLQYSETEDLHTKFDTILLGGRKEFILEIAPLLAFFNVDSRKIRILGTETFNYKEIKNEPSLEKAWFPIISSKNEQEFKFLWKEVWGGSNNYFSNAGFDSGIIAINYINNFKRNIENLNNVEAPVTGLILGINGYIKKPIQVMQIEDLGKLTNIKKCNKFKD